MANTFVWIVQRALEFHGHPYAPEDRLIADGFEGPLLRRSGAVILAPDDEQRAHGAHKTVPARKRGRPRKVDEAAPTYQRRDLQAEE